MKYEDKQKILEAASLEDRYETLGMILSNEIEIMQIRIDLSNKVKERVDKNQREYILREQMKVIREELGDQDTVSEADRFKEQTDKLKASKEVKEKSIRKSSVFKMQREYRRKQVWHAAILKPCCHFLGIKPQEIIKI